MVSAAKGAEEYYTTTSHVVRSENLDLARQLDDFASQVLVAMILPNQLKSASNPTHRIFTILPRNK